MDITWDDGSVVGDTTPNYSTPSSQTTGFWLTDAINAIGNYGAAYLNNRLYYESAEDNLRLYELQLQSYQRQAQAQKQIQGLDGVAGGNAMVLVLGLAVVGAVIWAVAK